MTALAAILSLCLLTIVGEAVLWLLFRRGLTAMHVAKQIVGPFAHIRGTDQLFMLAVLHTAFTVTLIVITFLFLW